MQACYLTTFDNPYNPFTQFNEWFLFDMLNGYNSCGYLANVSRADASMTEEQYNEENERAIDDIIMHDLTGMRRKVYQDSVFGTETTKLIQV